MTIYTDLEQALHHADAALAQSIHELAQNSASSHSADLCVRLMAIEAARAYLSARFQAETPPPAPPPVAEPVKPAKTATKRKAAAA